MRVFFSLVIWFFVCLVSFAETREKKFVFIGDSITAGYGVSQKNSFVGLFETYMKEKHGDIRVIASGVSGSTTASCTKRLKWQMKGKVDYLFLALGANDGLRGIPSKTSYKNLSDCLELASKSKIKIVFAGMLMPTNYGEAYRKEFSQIFPQLAKKYKLSFIPFLLEGVAGKAEFNLPDGIHPNEKGHEMIYKSILPSLEALL